MYQKANNIVLQSKMSIRQVYIKKVDPNHAPLIEHIFRENYGELKSIEIIRHSSHKRSNKYSARVFVDYWYNTQVSINFVNRLLEKGTAKIMYNDPHAWSVTYDRNMDINVEDLIANNKELYAECERLRNVARKFHHELKRCEQRYEDIYNELQDVLIPR